MGTVRQVMEHPHTLWFVLFSLLLFGVVYIIYDVWLITRWDVSWTISWQTLTFCVANPVATVIAGAILGLLTAHLLTDKTQSYWSLHQPITAFFISYFALVIIGSLYWTQRGPNP